jgi:hypothetical protein
MDQLTEEIYELVKKKVVEQAAYDRAAYDQLVEETIEYFKEKGKLTDEENEEFIKGQLAEMFAELQEEMADK